MPDHEAIATPETIEAFIARWKGVDGTERANYQLFLTDLCRLLDLPEPEPAREDEDGNVYVFERRVRIQQPDGTVRLGYIDLYRRVTFVLEAKQSGKDLDTKGWDKAMIKAYAQADKYVRALPPEEGRPPFIVVVDVGRSMELYSEFSRSGGTYVPYPDPSHHRIRLEDLRRPEIQQRLRNLWVDPDRLDASKHAARVTREVTGEIAKLARSLEQEGYAADRVAHFLKRCLFTMFSEDVELLPKGSFTALLERLQKHPEVFPDAMRSLWETMNTGGYEGQLMHRLARFNGGLFQNVDPIPLNAKQIGLLIQSGKADWRFVEPAIFGTLLERALDPRERHKLGAHYTPRAYVERLVMPTIIEPLRAEWNTAQVAAAAWQQQGKPDKALAELKQFHYRLCNVRVLDPACGSANFLYVAMENMKRIEGEVLNLIRDLSGGQSTFETEGLTVGPQQFLGLEINPRAAAIAEMVLWIGYLQWHYRLHGTLNLPDPILRDLHNIEHRDALIEYDHREPVLDEHGAPVTTWDGISFKESPVTGELIPDETGRTPVYRYHNPRKAQWPEADFIVGNPPFIGEKRMRDVLGDGYVQAVRSTYSDLPACDFVMYWWHIAAEKVRRGEANRFGFITTNSIAQTKNRGVTEPQTREGLGIAFAIPDHPWVDSADGAAVRIAMTVGIAGETPGQLWRVCAENDVDQDVPRVRFNTRRGRVFADLSIGAPVMDSARLKANNGLVFQGVKLVGDGFLISPEQRASWIKQNPEWRPLLPHLVAGSDITKRRAPRYCIDFFGFTREEAQATFPEGFQKILDEVKPFRDHVKRQGHRERFWIYGEARPAMRSAIQPLARYIVTSEVSKHRYFVFLETGDTLADGSLAVVAVEDASTFGVLSSRVHVRWAIAQGGRMGMGNDPRWQNGSCFLTFPFPTLTDAQAERIRDLAERIDAHRKRQQAEHPDLTLTGMYNVLEKLRAGDDALTDKERTIHAQGLVTILQELHDALDRAVFEAYGWEDLAAVLVGRPGATTPLPNKPADQAQAEEELLTRLVALNTQRAAEEVQGQVRWLRPEYQAPDAVQAGIETVEHPEIVVAVAETTQRPTWPKSMPDQVNAVRNLLAIGPQSTDALSAQFKRKPTKSVEQVLAALEVLGQAQQDAGQWRLV